MSRHMWQVFLYELKRNVRRKGFLFATFGIPLIGYALFFGYQFITNLNDRGAPSSPALEILQSSQFQGITKAGYVDLSGHFADPGDLSRLLIPYADEASAQAALQAGSIDVYYVIAPDFLETGDVALYMPQFTLTKATDWPIRQLVLRRLASGLDRDTYARLLNPVQLREINLQRDATGATETNFDADFAIVYVFALALMLSVFITNGYLMQTVIEEKETRLIEVLISGMRPTHLLAGKILALGLLGLAQIVVWVAAILLLARLAAGSAAPALAVLANFALPPTTLIVLLLYFVFGYLFFAAAYGIVSAVSSSMQEGPQLAVIFTLPAVIPLYFLPVFISAPDGPLAVALSLIPVTAPLSMVMRVSLIAVPAWQIVLSLALLAVIDGFLIWLAGRVFRVGTLLAGKTPKLRDLPKLVRG